MCAVMNHHRGETRNLLAHLTLAHPGGQAGKFHCQVSLSIEGARIIGQIYASHAGKSVKHYY